MRRLGGLGAGVLGVQISWGVFIIFVWELRYYCTRASGGQMPLALREWEEFCFLGEKPDPGWLGLCVLI